MELIESLRVIRRWFWLIFSIVVLSELALWFGTRNTEPVYTATVRLQITAPQPENVAAYDEYRSISLREEIVVATNNLMQLLQDDEVHQRVIDQLKLGNKESQYSITPVQVRDTDYIDVIVESHAQNLVAPGKCGRAPASCRRQPESSCCSEAKQPPQRPVVPHPADSVRSDRSLKPNRQVRFPTDFSW